MKLIINPPAFSNNPKCGISKMYKLSSNRKYLINYVKNDRKDGIDHGVADIIMLSDKLMNR